MLVQLGRAWAEDMSYIFEVVEKIRHSFALRVGKDIVVVYF